MKSILKKFICVFTVCALLFVCGFSQNVLAAGLVNVDNNYDFLDVAKETVRDYYQNKDLKGTNELVFTASDVSDFLQAKTRLGNLQNEYLNISYKNYEIEIIPFDEGNWVENDNEITIMLQVIRTWNHIDGDTSTSSEVQKVTLSKNENGEYLVVSCYDLYESLTLGPIDKQYQDAKKTKSNVDFFLENYIKNFENQCIEKQEQLEKNSNIEFNNNKLNSRGF